MILDTNVFLWIISGDRRLSAAARRVFLDDDTTPLLSIASVWEMMIKTSVGKLTLPPKPGPFIQEQLRLNSRTLLDVTFEHCVMVASLPFHHRDPFDRLVIAQSLAERMAVLSSDRSWSDYGVRDLF